MPADVRKGCAFPQGCSQASEALPHPFAGKVRRSLRNLLHNGKAQPFRTSGGIAANFQ